MMPRWDCRRPTSVSPRDCADTPRILTRDSMPVSASQLTALGRAPLAADGEVDHENQRQSRCGIDECLPGSARPTRLRATRHRRDGRPAMSRHRKITGTLDLKNGKINDYGRGVSLTDITAQIVGNEGTLQIKSFTAAGGARHCVDERQRRNSAERHSRRSYRLPRATPNRWSASSSRRISTRTSRSRARRANVSTWRGPCTSTGP